MFKTDMMNHSNLLRFIAGDCKLPDDLITTHRLTDCLSSGVDVVWQQRAVADLRVRRARLPVRLPHKSYGKRGG